MDRCCELAGRVVAPSRCGACDETLPRETLLCAACASSVERWNGNGQPFAFGAYGGALASVLLRLKYGGRPDLGPKLGLLLAGSLVGLGRGIEAEVVVPVPVPRSRLIERGFNQAALIAGPVARVLGAKFAPLALRRQEGGTRQAALQRKERLENLRGAYSVREASVIEGKAVLLVDDVSTTGATLASCAEVIARAGPRALTTAVVARVE